MTELQIVHLTVSEEDQTPICKGEKRKPLPEDIPPGTQVILCENCRLKSLDHV